MTAKNIRVKEIILLKYGEIVLKGLNRSYFNRLLQKRVKAVLKDLDGSFGIDYAQSTLYVRPEEGADADLAFERLKKVFGVVTVSKALQCNKDIEVIKKVIEQNGERFLQGANTFKCVSKRSDKSFEYKSPEICAMCGGVVLNKFPHMKVDVHNPEVTIVIEIRESHAFIHGGAEKGAGGMPVGSNGRGLLLLSGGIDSPVAGYMAAKRGMALDAVYFESPPYTGDAAKEKVQALAKKLSEYCGPIYLHTVSVTEISRAMTGTCDSRLFTILLRRFMMRIAEEIAKEVQAEALITGESIGQVASQTVKAIAITNSATTLPVFRPCIGLDKEEIVTRARDIGTLEISNLPYEDCCTVFTPKHPNTRPTEEEVLAEEAKLDVEGLVKSAMETESAIRII